jgi:hypothetical protein
LVFEAVGHGVCHAQVTARVRLQVLGEGRDGCVKKARKSTILICVNQSEATRSQRTIANLVVDYPGDRSTHGQIRHPRRHLPDTLAILT